MSKEPLLPTSAVAGSGTTFHLSPSNTSSVLCPLPENDEVSLPISPSSFKDRIIFGPSPPASDSNFGTLISSSFPSPSTFPICDGANSDADGNSGRSYPNDPLYCKSARTSFHRSRTAPAISAINNLASDGDTRLRYSTDSRKTPIVRNAFVLLAGYLLFGVIVYYFKRSEFKTSETHPIVDALYFCIVTMCTIGYGDITPSSTTTKIFSIAFVLIGFGFIDILLSAMISYVLDVQEHHLLEAAKHRAQGSKYDAPSYIIDVKKGRMRIRLKVGLALGVVVLCICAGVAFLRFGENLSWLDAFYLSVMSVTTVGYGDLAFKTIGGRIFASVWLLVSTLAVTRAFLYLVEARMDKRNREMAKWVLERNLTVSEFIEADIDNNGFVSGELRALMSVDMMKYERKIRKKARCMLLLFSGDEILIFFHSMVWLLLTSHFTQHGPHFVLEIDVAQVLRKSFRQHNESPCTSCYPTRLPNSTATYLGSLRLGLWVVVRPVAY